MYEIISKAATRYFVGYFSNHVIVWSENEMAVKINAQSTTRR